MPEDVDLQPFIAQSIAFCAFNVICCFIAGLSLHLSSKKSYGGSGSSSDSRDPAIEHEATKYQTLVQRPAQSTGTAVGRWTFPYFARRIVLANTVGFAFAYIDLSGSLNEYSSTVRIPNVVIRVVYQASICSFWSLLSLWLYYHSKSIVTQLRRTTATGAVHSELSSLLTPVLWFLPIMYFFVAELCVIMGAATNREFWFARVYQSLEVVMIVCYLTSFIVTYYGLRSSLQRFVDTTGSFDTSHITRALRTLQIFTIIMCTIGFVLGVLAVVEAFVVSSDVDTSTPAASPPTTLSSSDTIANAIGSLPTILLLWYTFPVRVGSAAAAAARPQSLAVAANKKAAVSPVVVAAAGAATASSAPPASASVAVTVQERTVPTSAESAATDGAAARRD